MCGTYYVAGFRLGLRGQGCIDMRHRQDPERKIVHSRFASLSSLSYPSCSFSLTHLACLDALTTYDKVAKWGLNVTKRLVAFPVDGVEASQMPSRPSDKVAKWGLNVTKRLVVPGRWGAGHCVFFLNSTCHHHSWCCREPMVCVLSNGSLHNLRLPI